MPTLRELIESNTPTGKIADALVAGRKPTNEKISGKGFIFFAAMGQVAKLLKSKTTYKGAVIDHADFVTSGQGVREGNGRVQFIMYMKDTPEKYVEVHLYQDGNVDVFYVNEGTGSTRTKTSDEITEWKKSELIATALLKIGREHLEKFANMYARQ